MTNLKKFKNSSLTEDKIYSLKDIKCDGLPVISKMSLICFDCSLIFELIGNNICDTRSVEDVL